MSLPVLDSAEDLVRGHGEFDAPSPLIERLWAALDYESTGRHSTVLKTMTAVARGLHVAGFILRPDDGISDVCLVSNGNTRELPPAEFQWLMHESRGCSILVDHAGCPDAADAYLQCSKEAKAEADALLSQNMEAYAVIRSLRATARDEARASRAARESLQELRDEFAFHCCPSSKDGFAILDKLDAVIASL